MSIVATEFPQQNLGIDDFLFTCVAVPTLQHGNEIPMSLCRNFIPMSLGIEIPTKWRGNEIPTNRPWELYTIYNPASRNTLRSGLIGAVVRAWPSYNNAGCLLKK